MATEEQLSAGFTVPMCLCGSILLLERQRRRFTTETQRHRGTEAQRHREGEVGE